MIRYRLKQPKGRYYFHPEMRRPAIFVILRAQDQDERVKIEYQGSDPILLARAEKSLRASYGNRGRLIGASASPIDLASAMNKPTMSVFEPELTDDEIEGPVPDRSQ